MHINKKIRWIVKRLISGGFILDSQVNPTVLKHVSKQVSVMGNINKPEGHPLDSDSSKADLIAIAGSGHIWLVALILLFTSALPFFLIIFVFRTFQNESPSCYRSDHWTLRFSWFALKH